VRIVHSLPPGTPGNRKMRIAITADVHLDRDNRHIERLHALQFIVNDISRQGIGTMIIAGDLFDAACSSYSDFEGLCRQNPSISFHVLPGNHDPDISSSMIVGDNVTVHQRPGSVTLGGLDLLFVPYSDNRGMGEYLDGTLSADRWVLVGHGDYIGGTRARNPYEEGTYMPLYRRDVERYKPWRVFLGHIHLPTETGVLHYPGSPCGLDINETGRRRYLIFDTETGRVSSREVETDVIFFKENFLVIPDENEIDRLRGHVRTRIASWGLESIERDRAVVRAGAYGYSSDREEVLKCLGEEFSDYRFYGEQDPDVSRLHVARDSRRNAIARRTAEIVDDLDWQFGGDEPDKEMVIERALSIIYGNGGGR
jgi:DNA repair protein SbcD/Mre11